eukprot:3137965-Pyramimonas_sp.AAC.1
MSVSSYAVRRKALAAMFGEPPGATPEKKQKVLNCISLTPEEKRAKDLEEGGGHAIQFVVTSDIARVQR